MMVILFNPVIIDVIRGKTSTSLYFFFKEVDIALAGK